MLESVGETALATTTNNIDSTVINSSFDSTKNLTNGNFSPPIISTNLQHQSSSFAGSVLRSAFKHISTDSFMSSSTEKVLIVYFKFN